MPTCCLQCDMETFVMMCCFVIVKSPYEPAIMSKQAQSCFLSKHVVTSPNQAGLIWPRCNAEPAKQQVDCRDALPVQQRSVLLPFVLLPGEPIPCCSVITAKKASPGIGSVPLHKHQLMATCAGVLPSCFCPISRISRISGWMSLALLLVNSRPRGCCCHRTCLHPTDVQLAVSVKPLCLEPAHLQALPALGML